MVRKMRDAHHGTYPPLNRMKRVVADLWIVDGPIIPFGMPWPKMPFPTRMTVIRCRDGDLFIHSPTALVPELKARSRRPARLAGSSAPIRFIIGGSPLVDPRLAGRIQGLGNLSR